MMALQPTEKTGTAGGTRAAERHASDKKRPGSRRAKLLISLRSAELPHWRCPQCGEWDSFV